MNPPDCQIHFCEQRSPEWFALRKGKLTASEFGPWLLKSDKTSQKARESAICRIVAGYGNLWEPPSFENAAMQRGTELEPDAIAAFETWSGRKVTQVGFCSSTHGRFGCSPDGLINDEQGLHGLECKVPVPATHIAYRRAGTLPDEYLFQVHGSLCVTGLSVWHFQSYNPGLASLRVTVERNEFTEELLAALKAFSSDVDAALAAEADAWEAEFAHQPESAAA